MNVALTLNHQNRAMLVYDQPLGFAPGWVECSMDGLGIRIISQEGREVRAGTLDRRACDRVGTLQDVLLVRIQGQQPVEGYMVPFISQTY